MTVSLIIHNHICSQFTETLHRLAYGTSEALSKVWMPLDEYTRLTMEGLRKGDRQISSAGSLAALQRFDAGKLEMAEAFHKMRADW
jgi:hypothetical protein